MKRIRLLMDEENTPAGRISDGLAIDDGMQWVVQTSAAAAGVDRLRIAHTRRTAAFDTSSISPSKSLSAFLRS